MQRRGFQKYKTELEHAEARSDIRKTQSCLDELLPSIQISLIGILVPIAVVGFLLLLVKFVPYFRRYLGNTNFRLGYLWGLLQRNELHT